MHCFYSTSPYSLMTGAKYTVHHGEGTMLWYTMQSCDVEGDVLSVGLVLITQTFLGHCKVWTKSSERERL